MNHVVKSFEDGSEITALQLATAVVVGAIGGTALFLVNDWRVNRKYTKARRPIKVASQELVESNS